MKFITAAVLLSATISFGAGVQINEVNFSADTKEAVDIKREEYRRHRGYYYVDQATKYDHRSNHFRVRSVEFLVISGQGRVYEFLNNLKKVASNNPNSYCEYGYDRQDRHDGLELKVATGYHIARLLVVIKAKTRIDAGYNIKSYSVWEEYAGSDGVITGSNLVTDASGRVSYVKPPLIECGIRD